MISQIAIRCVLALALIASVPAFAANEGDADTATSGHSTAHRRHVITFGDMSSSGAVDDNYFGVQGSLGLADQSTGGGVSLSSSFNPGMMWGAYYERRFFTYAALRAGVDFNQRGFNTSDGQGTTNSYQVNYLEFPLLVKAQYPIGIVTPFVTVGPSFGAELGAGHSQSLNGQSQAIAGFGQLLNGFNFALNFGGGVDFQVIRHFNIEVAARYSLGLTNVFNADGQAALANAAGQQGVNVQPTSVSLQLNDIQFLSGVSYSL